MDQQDAQLVFDDEEASDQHSDDSEALEDQEEDEDEEAVPQKKARGSVPWIEVEKTTAAEA
jgi:hypothetical protein